MDVSILWLNVKGVDVYDGALNLYKRVPIPVVLSFGSHISLNILF